MRDKAGKQIITNNGAPARHRIHMHFQNMVAGALHSVALRAGFGEWNLGPVFDQALGVLISGPSGAAVALNQFAIGPATVWIDPTAATRALELQIFLSTDQVVVLGTVTLPAGATLSVRSDVDRINLFGKSSWAVLLRDYQ